MSIQPSITHLLFFHCSLLSLLVAIPLGIAKDYAAAFVGKVETLVQLRESLMVKVLVICLPLVCLGLGVGSRMSSPSSHILT